MSTNSVPAEPHDETFHALRSRLFGIAYRMLGLRADAEDVVQDTWLRWRDSDHSAVQSAEAWLVSIATRLSIDRLRAAKTERAVYAGEWLPEPLVDFDERTPETIAQRADDLSLAFMHLLERLGPEERAAYLLRQAFDYDYGEIAAMLGKREPAIRQAVHRAAERLRLDRPRFQVPRETHLRLLERFVAAASTGDRAAIRALVADDVSAIGDGGGKVPSVRGGIHGGERVTNLLWAHHRRLGDGIAYRIAMINGSPGLLRFIDGHLESAQAVVSDGRQILSFYVVRNPDKLARIVAASP